MEGKQKPVNMFSHRWSVNSQMIFGSYFVCLTHCENVPTVIVYVGKEARGCWDSLMSQMNNLTHLLELS